MADDKERLSSSAAKAKRNLLFFAALAWALAGGWVSPSHEGRIVLAGIGVETTFGVILTALLGLLLFNLISLWIHGPFGDSRSQQRRHYLLASTHGLSANADTLLRHILASAGSKALPSGITETVQLDDWLHGQTSPDSWNQDDGTRRRGLDVLWMALSWRTKVCLWWQAIRDVAGRRLLLGDLWDLWLPLIVGASGLMAVGLSYWRLTR